MSTQRVSCLPSWEGPQLIRDWLPPDADQLHRADSLYVETFWLPVIGPTATWLLRKLAAGLEASDELVISFPETARAIGIAPSLGPSSVMRKTVMRLVRFRLMRPTGEAEWKIRTGVPPLQARHVHHLPESIKLLLALPPDDVQTAFAPE